MQQPVMAWSIVKECAYCVEYVDFYINAIVIRGDALIIYYSLICLERKYSSTKREVRCLGGGIAALSSPTLKGVV